ncbi:hypothetical protein [Actinomycetospora lemnae]|uniref:Uncharacterized protein n=1 Tax=Actinomycetospora lemnae TaxID=3019891 RepID=A0ABT5T0N1_9PSEU|nr:hypothetical protein [Actinomycetospora sp. DW7H6]MDD7968680.1 hypothetical protein [Actinomycetospora sp. DW7H6]
MTLRLPTAEVTVLLGEPIVRRRLMAMCDDASAGVRRITADPSSGVLERRRRLEEAGGAAVLLVDRVTDGLDATGRRVVLGALAGLAARGAAVLVDDDDSVAALAVADATLRADPARGLVVEPTVGTAGSVAPLEELYRAS